MSEVSVESVSTKTSVDDPQVDSEEADEAEESFSEDLNREVEDNADKFDDLNIDSDEEESSANAKSSNQDVQEGDGSENEMFGSVDVEKQEMNYNGDSAENPEESGDVHPETKESSMAEEAHRSTAAEIPVTSNGGLDQNPEAVFQRESYSSGPWPESCVSSSNCSSTAEGNMESGAHKGAMNDQLKSGAVVLSDDLKNPAMEKLELVRKWSINTYKCTRQILSEKLGRGSRTVDLELEAQIEILRDNKKKYQNVIRLAQTLANQLSQIMLTQRQLGDAFADLSLKSPELHEEFGYNADTQKLLSKNGDTLLGAINFFIASVNTLVDKTIEDTMINIKQYEAARVEYDAYRTDLEEINLGPRDDNTMPKIEVSQQQFQIHREKFERMRNDVSVKLKFLEENKVKVLHNQLILFHNAIAAYYAGNQQQLEQTLKQFHIKLKMPGGDSPSWLEEH
ncbi:arfaptin-1 isoform X2 [Gouania willdenowi]|uniref:AH domain-containing protein n=1 Tax=Gouania willdenowi TaxID=441366 RepID=A0A8C5DWU6_GOUWI|nr:arfaptin-1 isoform X2 [Gouania willdenowi]